MSSGTDRQPLQVRAAGVLVGLQGVAAVVFGVVLAVAAVSAALPLRAVLGEAGLFVVLGAALAGIGGALLTGRRGGRTPALVAQLLFLPVVYSLLGPSHQPVTGALTGVYVVATFLLLISEPARRWAAAPYDA